MKSSTGSINLIGQNCSFFSFSKFEANSIFLHHPLFCVIVFFQRCHREVTWWHECCGRLKDIITVACTRWGKWPIFLDKNEHWTCYRDCCIHVKKAWTMTNWLCSSHLVRLMRFDWHGRASFYGLIRSIQYREVW